MSTKKGLAPARVIISPVAKNVNGVVTASSPGPIPASNKGNRSASVPFELEIQCLTPTNFGSLSSG